MRLTVACLFLFASCFAAQSREIFSMMCKGKAVFFDSMDGKITIMLSHEGKLTHESILAKNIEHGNGYAAVTIRGQASDIMFRFKEHPVKGQDNNEAIITYLDEGGQRVQNCEQP